MDDKKYQIFVSSTYKDLIEAREAIVKTILSLYHVPIGMEMFSADDAEQWEIISETINVSDYYVVIIGHRYGSETSEGISFTEKEYNYARQQGIPVLAFIRKREVATKPEERDDTPDKVNKLKAFIGKATADKMCDYWETTDELAKKVAIALPKSFRRNPRIGWIRADKAASPAITEELARLSKENRELRDDYEQLKATVTDSKPNLSVLLNGGKKVGLSFREVDFSKRIITHPQKIDYSQVPAHLQSYVSKEEIEKYNSTLPPNKIIDIYNAEVERYVRLKKAGQELTVSIVNEGTSKANDVAVEIEFPELLLLAKDDDNFLKSFPRNPVPDNPIMKAEERYNKEHALRSMHAGIGHLSELANMERYLANVPNIHQLMSRVPPDFSNWVDKNVIHVRINGLLQTKQRRFADFIIAPLASGNFIAKASIICAEYKQQAIVEIPIAVKSA